MASESRKRIGRFEVGQHPVLHGGRLVGAEGEDANALGGAQGGQADPRYGVGKAETVVGRGQFGQGVFTQLRTARPTVEVRASLVDADATVGAQADQRKVRRSFLKESFLIGLASPRRIARQGRALG